ncbi:hypothetical protein OF83DRAFT_913987 [Amylostereum chailletii]|nr:hypothetical protein OF83DRAFT_913987 [Amylostereum chailletii]
MQLAVLVSIALALSASAAPSRLRFSRANQPFLLQNGQDAIALNNKFATLTANSPCTAGENACVDNKFAQCVSGKFAVQACAPSTICAALPLVNSAGTSITCTTASDRDARIAATGATSAGSGNASSSSSTPSSAASSTAASSTSTSGDNNASNGGATGNNNGGGSSGNNNGNSSGNNTGSSGSSNSGDQSQTSLTLDSSVIATGFEKDGQQVPTAGQVASLTSSNNFINFCKTVSGKPITNGQQVKTGSCNPAPMGVIASTSNMPSSKFVNPRNMATMKANTSFTIQMAINHIETGNFVNADSNYYAAPQQVNNAGDIIGHTHFVVEQLDAIDQTTLTDPSKFAFFKGVNTPAQGGVLSVDVSQGLPEGVYRLASINAAMNHQPVLVAIAQHGSLDDMVYFTVTADGKATSGSNASGNGNNAAGTATAAAGTATSTSNNNAGNGGKNNGKGKGGN